MPDSSVWIGGIDGDLDQVADGQERAGGGRRYGHLRWPVFRPQDIADHATERTRAATSPKRQTGSMHQSEQWGSSPASFTKRWLGG